MAQPRRVSATTVPKPTLRQALRLVCGTDWAWLDEDAPLTEAELQGMYERYRQPLLALCDESRKGSKPWAWFKYDTPTGNTERYCDQRPGLDATTVERWLEGLA